MAITPKPKPVKKAKVSARKFIKSRSDATKKKLERDAGALVREIVLLRDGYCVCPSPKNGHSQVRQCGHLITCAVRSVRWDLRNCNEQCASCNLIHEHRPEIYTGWFIGKFGADAYKKLCDDAAKEIHYSVDDMENLIKELKEILVLLKQDNLWKPRFSQEYIVTGFWKVSVPTKVQVAA